MSENIGALTTTFTPISDDCVSSLFYARESGQVGINLGYPGTSRSACLPTDFNPAATAYYSPGVCPSGYRYACSYTETNSDVETSIATCCPSVYECRPNVGSMKMACVSTFRESTSLAIGSYSMNSPTIITDTTTISISSGVIAYGFGPIVRRASTDAAWPTSTSSEASSSSLVPASTAAASTATASATSQSQDPSGLSTGAKAGIGVGVSVGGLILLALCVGAYILRKKRRRSGIPPTESNPERSPGELDGTTPVQELSAQEYSELPAHEYKELPSGQDRKEGTGLPGAY